MTRLILSILCCAQLWLMPVIRAQSAASGHKPRSGRDVRFQQVAEPPELAGPPRPRPTPLTPALRQLAESKAIRAADPKDTKTLAPAIRELTALIGQEPTNSDFHLLRATLSCYSHANSSDILDDISLAISLRGPSKSSAYPTLKEHYALKAKVEFETAHFEGSMRDLDAALTEDYDSAEDVFNDGNTKPSTTTRPCVWTQPDLDTLAQRFPKDYRPLLYRGLYLGEFYKFDLQSDYKSVIDAFERAAALNPTSALPHFFIGRLYTAGPLGGMMSMKNAECLDWVIPRTPACLALDEARRTGIRSFTRAIALDPKFAAAYALRASALYKLKEYRQAIRDHDRVLELTPMGETARISYSDRGLSKAALGQYEAAVLDFSQSIAIGCEMPCSTYANRADAYMKLHNYTKAIGDFSVSLKRYLSSAIFLMNVDQFRRIYPEYGALPDEVLCEKLRALFFPTLSYADFAKRFLIEAKEFRSTVLPELYVKRGDAYAAMNKVAKANVEYDRVSRAFPEWAAISFVEENGKRIRRPQ